MGHLSFYNKNQIRDKLLLVLIFAAGEVIECKVMVLDQKENIHIVEDMVG